MYDYMSLDDAIRIMDETVMTEMTLKAWKAIKEELIYARKILDQIEG